MKATNISDVSLLTGRIVLAIVIGAHGAQKLLGSFGGYGFEGTMGFFTDTVGLPYIVALLIILAESLGMVALVFGFASRLFAGALIPIMVGAILTAHSQFGFFMNWSGAQGGEGYEFHLLVIGLASIIFFNGGGAYSVDAYLHSKLPVRTTAARWLFN